MERFCPTCKKVTEFDEAFEDRFDPGSAYGHYQVTAGLVCLVCGNALEVDEVDYPEPPDDGLAYTPPVYWEGERL